MDAIRYCVTYSGGLVSYAAAKRVVERHGTEGVVALFADTRMEDEDLYRFVDETIDLLGIRLVTVCDGRTPWGVFEDERFIGNSRIDPCSKLLKRKLMDRWVDENCTKGETTLVYGLDWSERGRIEGKGDRPGHRQRTLERGWTPWYPMDEKPYLTKDDIGRELEAGGIAVPRLYKLGFPHNNCGGYCCKMGLAQARHLYRVLPDRYRFHEEQEQRLLSTIPTTKPSLKIVRRGVTRLVSLRELRGWMDQQEWLFDDHGWGCGGGCAIDD